MRPLPESDKSDEYEGIVSGLIFPEFMLTVVIIYTSFCSANPSPGSASSPRPDPLLESSSIICLVAHPQESALARSPILPLTIQGPSLSLSPPLPS